MNWRLWVRNVTLHAATASLLAAGCLSIGVPLASTHPVAALIISVVVMGLITVMAYHPLRRALQPSIDRLLFADRFSYLEVLGQLPNDLQEYTNLREMLEFLVTRLTDAAKLERVRVFMHDPGHQSYVEMVFRGSPRNGREHPERAAEISESAPLIQWLREESRLWTLEDLERLSGAGAAGGLAELRDWGGAACFPINKEKELLGLVLLGPKRSGEPFNSADLKVLRALRRRLENFLTQAMVLTQEALNMVKDSHDMKNDVNALKGRVSWRAMRLASWWMDFEKEIGQLENGLTDRQPLAAAVAALKQRSAEFYSDTQRALPIEEHAITRLGHHLRNWTEFGRVVAEGFRGRRPFERVDVGEAARLSVDRWKPMAEKKKLELSVEASGSLFIWGERSLLEQIIENLIDNSVRATEQGFVWVVCRKEENDISVEVRDSGCGIPAGDLAEIFDKPFYHSQSRKKLEPGSGVGLYLVAQYARSLGGRVSAESHLGEGSTFRVVLPAYRKESQHAEAAA